MKNKYISGEIVPYWKNKKMSEEDNKKKGRFGNKNAMSRPEVKLKQKIACRTYGKQWKGGKSFEPYGIEFDKELKEKVRKKDRFRCRECNYSEKQLGQKLDVHHIDYNKKNNKIENLISLCKGCHSQTNWKRDDWTKYFKSKLGDDMT